MAHSTHSTQPALQPHRTTPRAEDKPPQTHRPHSNGILDLIYGTGSCSHEMKKTPLRVNLESVHSCSLYAACSGAPRQQPCTPWPRAALALRAPLSAFFCPRPRPCTPLPRAVLAAVRFHTPLAFSCDGFVAPSQRTAGCGACTKVPVRPRSWQAVLRRKSMPRSGNCSWTS